MSSFNIEEAKKEYLENIRKYMTDTGSLFPHISVFGMDKTSQKKSIIHIPIPAEYVESSTKKSEFTDEIVPMIAKEVNKRFTIEAVGWASEAWMSVLKEDTKERKEVLFVMISSETQESVFVYEIQRTGKQVNSEGELTDIVELIENTTFDQEKSKVPMAGRFSDLYKKFKES
jgi:hypothetical protein